MKNILCLYHANCADGFGAAYAVWRKYPDAEFKAVQYGEAPPDVKGRDVLIVDFSYKRDVLLDMARDANSLKVIDHHKTAMEDLDNISLESYKIEAVFDMKRSGAVLTWETLHEEEQAPMLLHHIGDRDLWAFLLPDTKEIMAAVFSYEWTFELFFNWCYSWWIYERENLVAEGRAILRKHNKDVAAIAKNAEFLHIAGAYVPCVNCLSVFASDVGNLLAQGNPFAATWYESNGERIFSLRSTNDGRDVSAIAKYFGGGGHRNAAGFSINLNAAHTLGVADENAGRQHG